MFAEASRCNSARASGPVTYRSAMHPLVVPEDQEWIAILAMTIVFWSLVIWGVVALVRAVTRKNR